MFPDAPKPPSDDVQYAQGAFAVLMLGVPFVTQDGVNHVVYVAMLMQMGKVTLGQVLAAVEQPNAAALAADKIVGLFNVLQHCGEHVAVIGRSKAFEQQAKALARELMEMQAQLTQAAKQLMAAAQEQAAQGGMSPEVQAKIQERLILAQNQAQIDTAKAAQKQEQKDTAWQAEQERKNATVATDAQRKQLLTTVEAQSKLALTAVEAETKRASTLAEIANADMLARAEARRPKPAPASK
jgi:hypothetical protein